MIYNYKWITLDVITEDNFFIAYCNFINYNWDFVNVSITRQYIWSTYVCVAKFSWLTTEYIGNLREVLDKVLKHYKWDKIK